MRTFTLRAGSQTIALLLSIQCSPAAAEITHAWPAEGNALDAVGTAEGTLVGGMGFGDGFLGQGFLFEGVDDAVTVGTDVGNFGMSDFTVAFAIAVPEPDGHMEVMSKRTSCTFGSFWDIRMTANGALGFELRDPSTPAGTSTVVSVTDGDFHTVVFTREGTVFSAYVDGIRTSRFDAGFVANVQNNAQLAFGDGPCVDGFDGTTPFAGTLDEIRIADSAEPYLLLGDFVCGDAALNGGISALDALVTLKAAVGSAECPACVCDVNESGGITASDALAILRVGVGQPLELICPDCEF